MADDSDKYNRDNLSLPALRHLDDVCDRFEEACKAGQSPRIEEFIKDSEQSEKRELFGFLLLSELEQRCRNGEYPSLDEYHARFPDLRDTISETFSNFPWSQFRHGESQETSVPSDSSEFQGKPRQWRDRYTIQSRLGVGGCAHVLLAYDEQLKRQVAIKVPRPDSVLDVNHYMSEAQTVAQLSHPSIVQVHDVGLDDHGKPFVVMQYIDGGSLVDVLKSKPPSFAQMAWLAAQVADGVHHAHQHGFVHRDLKPGNILLDSSGSPHVSDFGLAMHESESSQHRGDSSGTPVYCSPEQVRGEADWMDGRCDIWAMGVILYEMLTGRRPFRTTQEILGRRPKPPRQVNDRVPEALARICLKCLAKDVEDRYATADDLARDLRRAYADLASQSLAKLGFQNDSHSSLLILESGAPLQEPPTPISRDIGPSPYKGLLAFDEKDANVFFGRENEIERLQKAFRALHEDTSRSHRPVRLLPIVGPSGCGKSSLARAGLVAQLTNEPTPGWKKVRVLVFQPGARPLESLATALARLLTGESTPLEKAADLQRVMECANDDGHYDGLRRIAAAMPDVASSPLVILVDQLDEIYALCDLPEARESFLENLLHAAGEVGGQVSVVITLRSDFLAETHDHPRLNSLIAEQCLIVPAMTKDQLRQAIAEPAKVAGHPLDVATVDLLVEQTYGREGALPLLQFALSRIWDGLAKDVEPAVTLKQLGGVGGALAGEAQRIHDSLSGNDPDVARRVFLALVNLGEGTRDTRRRVSMDSLVAHGEHPARVREVIDRFSAPGARLLTISAGEDGSETVEVTHEAIFDNWQLLEQWLDQSREDIRFQRRLDQAARHWDQHGRPEGLLWRSPDLEQLGRFHGRAGREMTPIQIQFFASSRHQQELQERRRRHRVRMYQCAALVFASLGIVATFLGYQALRYLDQATENARRAEQAIRLNLADGYRLMDDGDLLAAVPKLVEVFRLDEQNAEREPTHRFRLGSVLQRCPIPVRVWYDERTIIHAELSPDGNRLSLAARDGSVQIRDVTTGQVSAIKAHASSVRAARFSNDGLVLITASSDDTARLWNTSMGLPLTDPLTHDGQLTHAALSPDGQYAATASLDSTARLWSTASGEPLGEPLVHKSYVTYVAFDPSGRFLVTASNDRTAIVWNVESGTPVSNPLQHEQRVRRASFSPDGRRLITMGDDATARLWSIRSNESTATIEPVGRPMRHGHWVHFATFSPRGRYVLTASFDHAARLWNAENGQQIGSAINHRQVVNHAAFSVDGHWMATASSDGMVRMLNVETGEPAVARLRHNAGVSHVFFRHNRREIITLTHDGLVRLWRLPLEEKILGKRLPHRGPIKTLALSSDGDQLVTAGVDGAICVWNLPAVKPSLWPLYQQDTVEHAEFSPDDQSLLTYGAQTRLALIWDSNSGVLKDGLLHSYPLRQASFSPDGSWIVTLEQQTRAARLWNTSGPRTRKPIVVPPQQDERILHVAFSPTGDHLAVSSGKTDGSGGYVRIYRVAEKLTLENPAYPDVVPINHARYSTDGKLLATAGGTIFGTLTGTLRVPGHARILDLQSREQVGELMPHDDAVVRIDSSPAGSRVVTASLDHDVQVWETSTGRAVTTPIPNDDYVQDVSFSPDGRFILTAVGSQFFDADKHGYAQIRDAGTGDPVTPQLEGESHVFSARFLGDSSRLVTASKSGAKIWQFRNEDRPVLDLIRLSQLLSGHRTVENVRVALTADEYLKTWNHLNSSYPDRFEVPDSAEDNSAGENVLVRQRASWKYLDDGSDQGTAWRDADFDDSRWPVGPSPLGYGGGDEATVVRGGQGDRFSPVTTYFRHSFNLENTDRFEDLILQLWCDDAAHVYLNGIRVATLNVPLGARFDALAVKPFTGLRENFSILQSVDPQLLHVGRNVLAVELHQAETTDETDSRDLSFDLKLTANASAVFARTLEESTSQWERCHAARAMGFIASPASIETLRAAFRRETDLKVRAWVAASLAQRNQELEVVAQFLSDEKFLLSGFHEVISAYLNYQSWNVAKIAGLGTREYDSALSAVRAAMVTKPDNDVLFNTLGITQYRVGMYSEAIVSLRRSAELPQVANDVDPSNPLFIAMSLHRLGDLQLAQEHLDVALKLLELPKWKADLEMRLFREEAEALFGDPSARARASTSRDDAE